MKRILLSILVVSFCQASTVRRATVADSAESGSVVLSLPFWGQKFHLHDSHLLHFFDIHTNGDLVTRSDIAELVGKVVAIEVVNKLGLESWTETVEVRVAPRGQDVLSFSRPLYLGQILENNVPGTQVDGLEDLLARSVEPSPRPVYEIVGGDSEAFRLVGSPPRVIAATSVDRETRARYRLVVSARLDGQYTATTRVLVDVQDVNDNAPRFAEREYVAVLPSVTPERLDADVVWTAQADDPDNGEVRYSLNPTHRNFRMDALTGQLILLGNLAKHEHEVVLTVHAHDQDQRSAFPPATLRLRRALPAVRRPDSFRATSTSRKRSKRAVRPTKRFDVPEDVDGDLIRLGTDERDRFRFKEPKPRMLRIEKLTGQIRLRRGEKLDYEKEKEISFSVVITRMENSSVSVEDVQPVVITLSDRNDELPFFVNSPVPFLATVAHNAPPGSSVYQLMAKDSDRNSRIRYHLESGGDNLFEVDADTGIVRTRGGPGGRIGFRQNLEYQIGVSAEDAAATRRQKSAVHSLKILVGERDPQFFQSEYVAHVPENARVQYEIVQVRALSHQNQLITYKLTTESGDTPQQFAIDLNSGKVDLLRRLDYEKDAHRYHLKVHAVESDFLRRDSSVDLFVNLVDINDNTPMFPLSQYILRNLPENARIGSPVLEVTATDLDSVTNAQLTYKLSDGNFSVDSLSNIGYIKIAKALDYDFIYDHTYNFTVVATDNGHPPNSGTTVVRVSVTNVNDEAPVFRQSIEYVQVSEDAAADTVVHVVQAYDPDGDGVTYSFHGGSLVEGPFRIATESGIINLIRELDKSRVSYKLNITATDDGRCCKGSRSKSSQGLVVVEVKDINNNAPKFNTCGSYRASVRENEKVGTSVIQLRADDLDTGNNGNVSYSLVRSTDQDAHRFTIDQHSGILRTADVFDRESKSETRSYGVTVKASDRGTPRLAGFCTVQVFIDDVNDNKPLFDSPHYEINIEQGTPIGAKVWRVYATDKDAGENAQIDYYMKADPSYGYFMVDKRTGWITVAKRLRGGLLADKKAVNLTIEAQDRGREVRNSRDVQVMVKITNTVNQYPSWVKDYSAQPIIVDENAPVDHIVARLKALSSVAASKPNSDMTVNYIIQNGDTLEKNGMRQSFYSRIDDNRNEMQLKVYRELDYETTPVYQLTIKAANRATNSLHNETHLTIKVQDKNDEMPQFVGLDENGRYPGSVAENMEPGATVIKVSASDRDETPAFKKISYSIKQAGRDHQLFDVDQDSGVITTRAKFDREARDQYYITVLANDGAPSDRANHEPRGTPNKGEAEVQISITDKNDNSPFFKHTVYNATIYENSEVGLLVIMVTAEDKDKQNRLTYSIIGGNVGNVFEVASELGQIKVRGHLDYEDGPRSYVLEYRVFDDKFSSTTVVNVSIADVNDNAPRFKPEQYDFDNIVEEDRNVTLSNPKYLLTVSAFDPDTARRSRIAYKLDGQFAQDGTFTVNEHTGEVFCTKPLDRDAPNGRPVWSFNVLAYDEPESGNSLTGYAVVRVRPRDINDNAPVFDRNLLVGEVPEHSKAGLPVMTVVAFDNDEGNNKVVTYSLRQVPARDATQLFSIDPTRGTIFTLMDNTLDREEQDSYMILVQATDEGTPEKMSTTATVSVNVKDINDHPPKFVQRFYQATMSESFPKDTSIISVSATDKDIGDFAKLHYSLPRSSDRKFFTISNVEATNTGVLRVYNPIDYDHGHNNFMNVTVQVNDPNLEHFDIAYIEVHVTDYNDNAPLFHVMSRKVSIYENVTAGTTLSRFTASDIDEGINGEFYYAIDKKTDPRKQFRIDKKGSGFVMTTKKLDRETEQVHRIHILAIDLGIPPQTGTGTLIAHLLDINDNYPIFYEDYKPVIDENQEIGKTVVTLSAKDLDSSTNGSPFQFWVPCHSSCPCNDFPSCHLFQFRFVPGGGKNRFGSGIITTKHQFDREVQKYYEIPIIMKDSGEPPMSGTNTLTVTIGDINDMKHFPGHKTIEVYNYRGWKGQFRDAPLGIVHAEDEDDWDISDKEFIILDEDAKEYFQLKQFTGELYLKKGVPEGVYTFRVSVYDRHWKRKVISTVTIEVKEIGDDAVYSSASVRFSDITAEEFINRAKSGLGPHDYGKSLYDQFREEIAQRLMVPIENVDIFSIRNHPSIPRTTDIRFAAHGSPYYRPVKLNTIVKELAQKLKEMNLNVLMSPVNECIDAECESDGCSNILHTTSRPVLTNTNGTSHIGVHTYVTAECICLARHFTDDDSDTKCRPDSCFNGGTCREGGGSFSCVCPPKFRGSRCQQTHLSFRGQGWAWFDGLPQCADSHTSIEILTKKADGVILYHGPTDDGESPDYMLLELNGGYPILHVRQGYSHLRMAVNGKYDGNILGQIKLNDGRWHRIDIFKRGNIFRLTVDHCHSAKIIENDNEDFYENREACEVEETLSDVMLSSALFNISSQLQIGGLANPNIPRNLDLSQGGFVGCVKNLIHNGEMYDLHVGRVGAHKNALDGCLPETKFCSLSAANQVSASKEEFCGANGNCVASMLGGEPECTCLPGWSGKRCQRRTTVRDFGDDSFIEWDFTNEFYRELRLQKHWSEISLMFRSRQRSGLLFKILNMQKTEYLILEIRQYRLYFRFNVGGAEQRIYLSRVNASDGNWHHARAERRGRFGILSLDLGEGRLYNTSIPELTDSHVHFLPAQRLIFAGGDVKFAAVGDEFLVDFDFKNGCMNDIRYNGRPLPMRPSENAAHDYTSQLFREENIGDGCTSAACQHRNCASPLVCADLWRHSECRCPFGQRRMPTSSNEICTNINECDEDPCYHGDCRDIEQGFVCECHENWSGQFCAIRREARMAYVSTGAILAIIVSLLSLLLLILMLVIFSRRRHPEALVVSMDPDDDVRENIIHYDEEGVGEEDQDSYDINRLKKPIDEIPHLSKPSVDYIPPLPHKLHTRPPRLGHKPDVGDFINDRLDDADNDPQAPPHDTIQQFSLEGAGSISGSLSSLASSGDNDDSEFDYLENWGPRFSKLADLYGGVRN